MTPDRVARDSSDAVIASAYDRRAAEYIEVAGRIDQMTEADRVAIGRWRDDTPGVLIDAGCGPGHWTDFLHDDDHDAIGIDVSEEFVSAARTRHPDPTFEVASFRALPFDDASVDGILAWYSLIHAPPADIPAVLREFARVTRAGGGLLVGFFDGPPLEEFAHGVTPAYFWSATELGARVEDAGFSLVESSTRERQAGEISGRAHGHLAAIRRNPPRDPA